ncbi:hypothetical protein ACFFSW_16785 [Saccharothrix longispora]|uniref:IPT/TIG domain-containing protein n=1 Tax=Saccharothrix longispora TaxID=33920 RepID=A0ABU1Q2F9_9PSEU|nr:hypothetical protein [Saccharothrix longispora]MDR6596324.1 hypothetical protein [Saccharothrix longispora]
MRRRRSGVPALLLLPLVLAACADTGRAPVPLGMTAPSSSMTALPSAHLAARPVAGAANSEIRLSGEGYPAHGRVVFTFHGAQVGETTADAVGRFAEVAVVVPTAFGDAGPGTQVTIGATSGPFYAETPFVLTR